MIFHLLLSHSRSDEYLLSHCEKRQIFGIISQQLKEY